MINTINVNSFVYFPGQKVTVRVYLKQMERWEGQMALKQMYHEQYFFKKEKEPKEHVKNEHFQYNLSPMHKSCWHFQSL